jgi:hypothetical protein
MDLLRAYNKKSGQQASRQHVVDSRKGRDEDK